MAANDLIETSWQCESEHEVRDMQQKILLPFQQGLRIFVLAFWTVPVAAGGITVLHVLTVRAAVNMPTQGFCATLFNCPHGLEMSGWHACGIFLAIRFSVVTENVRQLYCHKFSRTWLIDWMAWSSLF